MYNLFRIARTICSKSNSIRAQRLSNTVSNVSDTNTNVLKDVILFKYDNPRLYKIVNIFAGCQFLFWSYLAYFAYTSLRNVPPDLSENAPWWKKINLGEKKYRNAMAIFSLVVGNGLLIVSWSFTLRSVRYLILRKGGKQLSIVTYTPLGPNRILTVGLENIDCKYSRTAARSQIPIKVKGHLLHYILDARGEFKNPVLFDQTAGLTRNWKK